MLSFSVLGTIFGTSGKKIFRWYKNVLSGFANPDSQTELHRCDTYDSFLIDKITKKPKKVFVPILKPENMGEDLAIDDKNIDGKGCTILSNKNTGKIILMMTTTKARLIMETLDRIPVSLRMKVKTISKDLAESYDWVARTMFMNAARIADKFHVIKLALEAMQAVRIRYRQAVLTEERKQREEMKKEGKLIKDLPPAKRFKNGETLKEILARSRYLLFKFKTEWDEFQTERSEILFQEFPEIKQAYDLICGFRNFLKCKIGDKEKARESLYKWYDKVSEIEIDEIQNFAYTVQKHQGEILNYFEEGHTNAFAESLNSKIQRFIRSNYGVRNRDFFHFRMMKYFS